MGWGPTGFRIVGSPPLSNFLSLHLYSHFADNHVRQQYSPCGQRDIDSHCSVL